MPTPTILDCDPGHDDAIALLLALASPELDILGVTTTYGNQTLAKTTANALRVLELVERADVPVAAGAERPLQRELVVAAHVHGESGLDGSVAARRDHCACGRRRRGVHRSRRRNVVSAGLDRGHRAAHQRRTLSADPRRRRRRPGRRRDRRGRLFDLLVERIAALG